MGSAAADIRILEALVELVKDAGLMTGGAEATQEAALGEKEQWPTELQAGKFMIAFFLKTALRDRMELPANEATDALGRMGSAAARPEIKTRIFELLHDRNMLVQIQAVVALGDLGSTTTQPEIVSKLFELLNHRNEFVRWAVVDALGRIGSAAARVEILTRLLDVLCGGDAAGREVAAEAKARINAGHSRLFSKRLRRSVEVCDVSELSSWPVHQI